MAAPDNSATEVPGARATSPGRGKRLRPFVLLVVAMTGLVACNRMATPPAKQVLKDADAISKTHRPLLRFKSLGNSSANRSKIVLRKPRIVQLKQT